MIKQCLFILIYLILLSCNKPHYDAFSDKDLDFVTYYSSSLKTIKFIDITGTLITWRQTDYDRSFHEWAGQFYGSTGHYQENFRATFIPETGSGQFYIAVRSASFSEPDILTLSFNTFPKILKLKTLIRKSILILLMVKVIPMFIT